MAAADGLLRSQETDLIVEVYGGLTGERIDRGSVAETYINWQSDGSPDLMMTIASASGSLDDRGRRRIFKAVCLVMLSDGAIAESERQHLAEIAAALDIDEIGVSAVLADLRLGSGVGCGSV
jgi:hypothetical protein